MARRAEDWRRRLTGRTAFDPTVAEAAIKAAYHAAGLPGPGRILWAGGPRDAVRMLRFLADPPRRQRWLGRILMAAGATLWAALAFFASAAQSSDEPRAPLLMIAAVIGFYLAREGAKPLPPPPGMASVFRGGSYLQGIAVFALMMGALVLFHRDWVALGVSESAICIAVAALAGALPGALLLFRLQRAYGAAPAEVRELASGRSVARPMWRARRRILPHRPGPVAVHPFESLVRAHQHAYGEAFESTSDLTALPDELLVQRRSELGWISAPPRSPGDLTVFMPVPHLDGIADSAPMQAVDGKVRGPAQAFADLAFYVDRLFPFRNLALAVRPPTSIALDAEGRPHAEDGPAMRWADGSEVYAWRGRVVERSLVCVRPLTPAFIAAERDPDRQSVLVERYGLGRFLAETGAIAVHADECGQLYRLHQLQGEPIAAVHVVNASPEPDGSFRDFWLRVPPTVQTAREAVAWTFGLQEQEYRPMAQS